MNKLWRRPKSKSEGDSAWLVNLAALPQPLRPRQVIRFRILEEEELPPSLERLALERFLAQWLDSPRLPPPPHRASRYLSERRPPASRRLRRMERLDPSVPPRVLPPVVR